MMRAKMIHWHGFKSLHGFWLWSLECHRRRGDSVWILFVAWWKIRLGKLLSLSLCLTELPCRISPAVLSSVSLSPSSTAICSGPYVFSTAANILHNTVQCFPGQHCLPACLAHVSPVSRGNTLRLGVGGFLDGKHEEQSFVTQFCILFGRDWGVGDQLNRDYGDACLSWFQLVWYDMTPSPLFHPIFILWPPPFSSCNVISLKFIFKPDWIF